MSDEYLEEEHQLRLSIEFHSIKDLQHPHEVYFKFANSLLGSTRTQSFPVRRQEETRIQNAFQARELRMTKSSLYPSLSSTPLEIEVWEAEKYAKDHRLGTATLQLEELLKAPLKKTPESVLRVLDVWLGITSESAPLGQIRVMVYLEDLGSKQRGAVFAQSQKPSDYQAAWELELWRRAEEARWKSTLQEKETAHIASLAVKWQERETFRDNSLQNLMNSCAQLENKVRAKALELQKRETKIVSAEDELRQKIGDVTRQLAIKEEELVGIKHRAQDSRMGLEKDRRSLEKKIDVLREEIAKTEQELYRIRREQDSEMALKLREEVTKRHMENMELSKKSEQLLVAKDGFKRECERLKEELVRVLKIQEEEKAAWLAKEREEIWKMRTEYYGKKEASEKEREREEELSEARSEAHAQEFDLKQEFVQERSYQQRSNFIEGPIHRTAQAYQSTFKGKGSELERLKQEKQELLSLGIYTEDDPLIQELNKQILIQS